MSRHTVTVALGAICLALWTSTVQAGPISVPNASFESPAAPFVSVNIDSWQMAPKPVWYDEDFDWNQLTGIFKNTPPGSADHIDNCDGAQAIWLFAVLEVGLFQDYDSMDWNDASPSHEFDARFEAGKSYQLTVGVIGGGGGMKEDVTLDVSLYYRDTASNRVSLATTTVTNRAGIFGTGTHFLDAVVRLPTVKSDDPWAGQHIGVGFLSTVSLDLQGGYWDLDNVRLESSAGPTLVSPAWREGRFEATVQSEPGSACEILGTSHPVLPVSQWTRLTTLTNVTGIALFTDTNAPAEGRFYAARQLP